MYCFTPSGWRLYCTGTGPHGKLFFVDILQLMTDTRGRKVAGVGMLPGHSGVTTSDRVVKKKPALSQMGRSMTMSNVVLHSEASAANSDPMNEASRAKVRVQPYVLLAG